MDALKLKLYIKKLIKEELETNVKEILRENLIELLSNTNDKKNSNGSQMNSEIYGHIQYTKKPSNESNKPKIKYTSNKLLNDVLNETVGGIPPDASSTNILENAYTSNKIDESAPEPVKKINSIINRDYSSTLKAIDKIKSSK